MDPIFNIAICGGGNLAHSSVAAIGHLNPKYTINVLSTRPEVWNEEIKGYTDNSSWEHVGTVTGRINKCSNNAAEVVPGANIIIICSPAHTKKDILEQIKPYIEKEALVGTIFGQGGFDFMAKYVLGDDIEKKNLTIFSMQYVPLLCKVINYG